MKFKRIHLINLSLVLSSLVLLAGIAGRFFVFGSEAGRWVYPYFRNFSFEPVLILFIAIPLILSLFAITTRYIRKHEWPSVILICLFGFFLQVTIYTNVLGPISIESAVKSEGASPYYKVALEYSFTDLLKNYTALSRGPLLHIQTNMPGKVIFYQILENFTKSPQSLGYLIILIENLSGFFIYLISIELFKEKNVAVIALFLYILTPAKLFFSPILNAVSPLFSLLSFYILLRLLKRTNIIVSLIWGLSIYLISFFEPQMLTTLILQSAFMGKSLLKKEIKYSELFKIIVAGLISLITVHLLVTYFYNFDIIRQYFYIYGVVTSYDLVNNRRYLIWFQQNLVDFFVNSGLLVSIVYLGALIKITVTIYKQIKISFIKTTAYILETDKIYILSLAILIFFINFTGAARGEVARLWIYLMVFMEIAAAYVLYKLNYKLTTLIVLSGILLQSVVSLSMVKFIAY